MEVVSIALFVVGYPVSIAVIARWIPVVRERRQRWFVAHTVAVAAIVTGWMIRDRWSAVAINSSWLIISCIWYALSGRAGRRAGWRGSTLQR